MADKLYVYRAGLTATGWKQSKTLEVETWQRSDGREVVAFIFTDSGEPVIMAPLSVERFLRWCLQEASE